LRYVPLFRKVTRIVYCGPWTVYAGPPSGEKAAARQERRYSMKILVLIAVLAALVLPASASAVVTPYYTVSNACVSVDTSTATGSRPIVVVLSTPDGRRYDAFRTSPPFPTQAYVVCVSQDVYNAEGGYGWSAVASVGQVSLGSTVF
jgi:hypothetical protein